MAHEEELKRWESALSHSLRMDLPYSFRPTLEAPPGISQAAVLALIGLGVDHLPQILVTKRTETVATHKGQMAFPGGLMEEQDFPEGLARTVLRETEEEVGLGPEKLKVIGQLPWFPTVSSGLWIAPFVGLLREPIHQVSLHPNPEEISRLFWVRLQDLDLPGVYRREYLQWKQMRIATDTFLVEGERIWGATGAMIRNLLDRLNEVRKEIK